MTDVKVAIMELLRDGWGLDFVPRFGADWYDPAADASQVVISQVLTQPRTIGFSDDPSTSQRRFDAVYAVDVWSSGDADRRWRMLREVDRILHSKCCAPGGGLEFVEVSSWRDLDEADVHPRLYRSQLRVQVTYYA